MARRVAIVGTSLTTRPLAPWDDKTVEIWTLGKNYKHSDYRCDRHYELHELAAGFNRWSPQYVQWMEANSERLWIQTKHPKLPKAKIFPINDIIGKWRRYLTCQIAEMIGHALLEHSNGQRIKQLGIYGCDLAQDSPIPEKNEYAWQRPSVEYWVGLCEGAGIDVIIPAGSDICKSSRIYGYEDDAFATMDNCIVQREQELAQRMQQLEMQIQQASHQKAVLAGAAENLKWTRHFVPAPYTVDEDSFLAKAMKNGDNGNGSADTGAADGTGSQAAPKN